jgi:hypothetical protein
MRKLADQRHKKEMGVKFKQDLSTYLKENKNNPYICFRLTDLKKMGINPKSEFKDMLFGLYAYPLTPYTISQLYGNSLTHAGDMSYIYTLEIKKANTILIKMDRSTPGYSTEKLESDIEKVKKWYPDVDYEKVDQQLSDLYKKQPNFGDFQKLYYFVLSVARELASDTTAGVKVTAMMVKLGVYAIIDLAATFHTDSPFEAVILKPGHYTNLQIFDNKSKKSEVESSVSGYNFDNPVLLQSFNNLITILGEMDSSDELTNAFTYALKNRGFTDLNKQLLTVVLNRLADKLNMRLLNSVLRIRPEILELELNNQDDKITQLIPYLKNYNTLMIEKKSIQAEIDSLVMDSYNYNPDEYALDKKKGKIDDKIKKLRESIIIDAQAFSDLVDRLRYELEEGTPYRDILNRIKETEIEGDDDLTTYFDKVFVK